MFSHKAAFASFTYRCIQSGSVIYCKIAQVCGPNEFSDSINVFENEDGYQNFSKTGKKVCKCTTRTRGYVQKSCTVSLTCKRWITQK